MLTAISEELKDVVMFYHLPELASALHATVPTMINFQVRTVNHLAPVSPLIPGSFQLRMVKFLSAAATHLYFFVRIKGMYCVLL